MVDSACPECGFTLTIIPMEPLHVGVLECDDCSERITWRSEAGNTEFEFIEEPD